MKKQNIYFRLTLVISVLVAIILPLAIATRPIDLEWFFYLTALGFTLVWTIYSIILFGYVFLVKGKHIRNKFKARRKEDLFALHSIQEWEALWQITVERYKDPRLSNHRWN